MGGDISTLSCRILCPWNSSSDLLLKLVTEVRAFYFPWEKLGSRFWCCVETNGLVFDTKCGDVARNLGPKHFAIFSLPRNHIIVFWNQFDKKRPEEIGIKILYLRGLESKKESTLKVLRSNMINMMWWWLCSESAYTEKTRIAACERSARAP